MNQYTFHCESRDYSSYSFTPALPDGSPLICDALLLRLFDGDILDVFQDVSAGSVKLCHSPIRSGQPIYGTLILQGNRTYGRTKSKLFYQCIPYQRNLPIFLVPYDSPTASHSKYVRNRFVAFEFREWKDKHPIGTLTRTFGDANSYDAFTEFSLYSHGLMSSITALNKHCVSSVGADETAWSRITEELLKTHHRIEDRRSESVISIDPIGCVDIDDAFSIRRTDTTLTLSIYIANVPMVLDIIGAWEYLSERTSTVYLPQSRVPMLPTILSDNICSLLQEKERLAIAFDFSIPLGDTSADSIASSTTISPCIIRVSNNYHYDDVGVISHPTYRDACEFIERASREKTSDTHRTIEWMMIAVNKWVADWCIAHGRGVVRGLTLTKPEISGSATPPECLIDTATPEFRTFLQSWNTQGGEYTLIDAEHADTTPIHSLIGHHYTHASSPIRRIVDLINLTLLQHDGGFLSHQAGVFLANWMTPTKVHWIQEKSKEIRRVQNDCTLMWLMSEHNDSSRDTLLSGEYRGVIVSADVEHHHGESDWEYTVYVFELKRAFHYWSADALPLWWSGHFKFYIFDDADRINQKLRIRHINTTAVASSLN
jgi:exoribonuclease R